MNSKIEQLLSGIELIRKYEPDPEIAAEHDVIYIGDYQTSFIQMTEQERQNMTDWRWFEQYDSWAIFT